MKKQPEDMTICNLQVLLMPNGEILCLGKTVGFFKTFKDYLEPVDSKAVAKAEGKYDTKKP